MVGNRCVVWSLLCVVSLAGSLLSGCAGKGAPGAILAVSAPLQVLEGGTSHLRRVTRLQPADITVGAELRGLPKSAVADLQQSFVAALRRELDVEVGPVTKGAPPRSEARLMLDLRTYREDQRAEGTPFAEVGFRLQLVGPDMKTLWGVSYHKADRPIIDNLLLSKHRGSQGLTYRHAKDLFEEGLTAALQDLQGRWAGSFQRAAVR